MCVVAVSSSPIVPPSVPPGGLLSCGRYSSLFGGPLHQVPRQPTVTPLPHGERKTWELSGPSDKDPKANLPEGIANLDLGRVREKRESPFIWPVTRKAVTLPTLNVRNHRAASLLILYS